MTPGQKLRNNILWIVALLVSFCAYLVANHFVTVPLVRPLILELLVVLTVVIAVHLLEKLFLWNTIRAFLAESVRRAVRNATELVKAADQCGLSALYPNRESAANDVKKAINGAQKRIWLLGIAFSKVITLDKILANLGEIPAAERPELRVLLLDALRSPALFRTFLESPLPLAKRILEEDRTRPLLRDPICTTALYDDCQHASNLIDLNDSFRDCVKFYAHNPNCWMVITDDVCFYEPYTFGRPASFSGDSLCLGMYMPVSKFTKRARPKAFEILEDHFLKLWLTSEVQQIGFGARLADTQRLMKEILDERQSWFDRVYEALERSAKGERDQRQSLRSPCESFPSVFASLEWAENDVTHTNGAAIVDFSRAGLGVQLSNRHDLPSEGIVVWLVPRASAVGISDYTLHLVNYFQGRPLKVNRLSRDTAFVGLRLCPSESIPIAIAG